MADDRPAEWAFERVERLRRPGEFVVTAFARYIEQHEQAPDPLIEAIQLVWDYPISCNDMPSIRAHQLRDELAKRGLTITASDASASVQSPGCVDAAPGRKGGQ